MTSETVETGGSEHAASMMRPVTVALAAGLALLAVGVVLVLQRSPLTQVGSNSIPAKEYAEVANGEVAACQPAGPIPLYTSAIRMSIEARAVGPAVVVAVIAGSRVVSHGRQPAGWGTAPTVTVPIERLDRAISGARVCTSVGPSVEPLRVHGVRSGASAAGAAGPFGRIAMRMEYLRDGAHTWWSLASATVRRMGLGGPAEGAWIGFAPVALVLIVVVLLSRLILRELP
jgi:hypothetical protein